MNLTDLRTELSARATESADHPYGDLLPGVQRKVRGTKRRRAATALAGTAAVAALAIGVLPNLTSTDTPQPAATPSDFISNGMTFPGQVDGDELQIARVGRAGENTLGFEWIPAANRLTIRAVCSVTGTAERRVRVSIDDVDVTDAPCNGSTEPADSTTLPTNDALWTQLWAGDTGSNGWVQLTLIDSADRAVTDPGAVIGVGLYTTADRVAPDPMPSQEPPTSLDDYVKDGIRYRTEVGDDTLTAARVGDQGERELTIEFTPATDKLSFRPFCLGSSRYEVSVSVNGKPANRSRCGTASADPGGASSFSAEAGRGWDGIRTGQANTALVRVTDRNGRPVPADNARIGLGIYAMGAQRLIEGDGDRAGLGEVREYLGHLYRLAEVRTAPARSSRSVSIDTPAGVPFLVAFGSTDTGIAHTSMQLAGLDNEAPGLSGPNGAGLTYGTQPSRAAGQATAKVTAGTPTKGQLFIATYTPVR